MSKSSFHREASPLTGITSKAGDSQSELEELKRERDELAFINRLNRILTSSLGSYSAWLTNENGRAGTMTHDYKRNGTTTLFVALNTLDGRVIGQCLSRHRHQEFLKFLRTINRETRKELDLHLIVDNYGTHSHPKVTAWLDKHPRFHMHFTPTSASWLNLVERWFREITDKRIRRGAFKSVDALVAVIIGYLEANNAAPKPFVWTASMEIILSKVKKANEALDALH